MFIFQPPFVSSPPKPTVVVVSGAILHHISYSHFAEILSSTGHRVLFPELASDQSFRPAGESIEVDVAALRDVIVRQVEAGNKLILVMHSYGCIVGCAAAKGLSMKQRVAAGKTGGIVGLISIAGFIVRGGMSVTDTLPGGVLESTDEYPIGEPISSGYSNTDNLEPLYRQLYNTGHIPESSFRANYKRMLTESKLCLTSPSPEQGWADEGFNGRRAYIYATQDTCLPLPQQFSMTESSGVEWLGEVLEAGHDICKTHTEPLVEAIANIISEFDVTDGTT